MLVYKYIYIYIYTLSIFRVVEYICTLCIKLNVLSFDSNIPTKI